MHTLKQCNGVHCRCLGGACPNYHFADCELNVGKKETGHDRLIRDIKDLLADAQAGEFGDFTNEKYAAPKVKLAEILHTMREKVINGDYDE